MQHSKKSNVSVTRQTMHRRWLISHLSANCSIIMNFFQLSDVLGTSSSSPLRMSTNNSQHPPNMDMALLDKLVTSLLEKKVAESSPSSSGSSTLKKLRPLSRSLSRSFRLGSLKRNNNSSTALPTIVESGSSQRSTIDNAAKPSVKSVMNTIKNAPQRFSTCNDDDDESKRSLTQNILNWKWKNLCVRWHFNGICKVFKTF